MIRIRPARRPWVRGTRSPSTGEPHDRQPGGEGPHLVSRPGSDSSAGRFIQHVAGVAGVAADQNRPAPTTAKSRLRAITMPCLRPHTIHLCSHCRHNPAGFWVNRTSDQTARRPWCLSCCQDLDPAFHRIRPFDLQYLQ